MSRGHTELTKMDTFRAVQIAEGLEPADEHLYFEAWQYLHDTGAAYQLQGWYGRQAQDFIYRGEITE